MVVRRIRPGLLLLLPLMSWACGGDAPPPPPPDKPATFPTIDAFTTSAVSVRPGETVTVSWMVRDADEVRIEPGLLPSTPSLSGQVETEPLQSTVTYTLRATSAAGDTQRRVTVTVVTGKVEIVRFEAQPALIEPGQTTQLFWDTTGASEVKISDASGASVYQGQEPMGMVEVQPTQSTTYELTVLGDETGPKTQTAQVLVGAQPTVVSFAPDSAQITEGQSTILQWQVQNAQSVEIRDQDDTMILVNGAASGQQAITPSADTTYTLIATSPVGTAQKSTTVEVLPPGSPRIIVFNANPVALTGPGQVMLLWETVDADTVDLQADGMSVAGFPRTAVGTMSLEVSRDTTLTLIAENDAERSTQTIDITVGTPDSVPPQIMHTVLAGVRTEGTPEQITATIVDAESNVASATLFYRRDGQSTFQTAVLTDDGNDRFSAEIPGSAVMAPAVEYYIQATDDASSPNGASSPAGAPANLHRFDVQPNDQTVPMITVTAVAQDRLEDQRVSVSAVVNDATGVAGVTLYYRPQGQSLFIAVPMQPSAASYAAEIPPQGVLPPGVDYYVEAEDTIIPANVGRSPVNAPTGVLNFSVLALDRSPPVVTHTPVSNGQAEGNAVTVSAAVTDDSGVGAVTLYYKARNVSTYTTLVMTGAGDQRSAQIPVAAVLQPAVDYYIEATDLAVPTTNRGASPSTAPTVVHAFSVSPVDIAPPTVSHTPIQAGPVPGAALQITATVVDGSGVASVTLFYRTTGTPTYAETPMVGAGSTYSAQVPGASIQAPGLQYYFNAVDSSPMANAIALPMGAPTTVFSFETGVGEVEPNDVFGAASPFLSAATPQAVGMGGIMPSADRDYWIIDVPTGTVRYTVRLEVTTGGAGTCPQFDSELFLLDSDGSTVLVTDDSGGVGACSLIDPVVEPAARGLAPGRYYVQVQEDGQNRTVAQYELRGRMDPVVCGNSLVESPAGELCDDGNVLNGDGCSSTCQFEPLATFMAPGGTFSDAISPSGDQDLYALVITQGQFLTAFTSAAGGTGCPGDTVIEFYDTDGVTRLGTDDDDGASSCSNINPFTDTWTASLSAGTYWLRVRGYNSGTVLTSYDINVQISDNLCGNSIIETGEQCDDGGTTSNDGCSATCQDETVGVATGTGGSFTGALDPVGNIDWYQVIVQNGQSIRAETFVAVDGVCTADTVIRLWQADRSTQITSDDDGGLVRCSLLDPTGDIEVRDLAAGTYYLSVEEYGNNSVISAYTLNIVIQNPVCGDGWVGTNEQCDDSNLVSGDGCSAACAWEGTAEVEPNDLSTQAGLLLSAGNMTATAVGVIGTSGDVDYYEITVPMGGSVLAEVVGFDGGCPTDSAISLRTAAGTELVSDTRDGPGECGRISPGGDSSARGLLGGTYYLRVSGTSSNNTYQVRVQVFAPGCGDLYLSGTEQCDDGNTATGDGCSATCQYEITEMEPNNTSSAATSLTAMTQTVSGSVGTAGDNDWYSITVLNGARISVFSHSGALDQCPTEDTRITIYDDAGTVVLANDDNDGPRFCSAIYADEAGVLAAGTYRIRVEPFNLTQTFNYALWVEVR